MPKWDFDVPESIKAWEDTKLPNDRKYIESLPGVGRKTANVFLSNIYITKTSSSLVRWACFVICIFLIY